MFGVNVLRLSRQLARCSVQFHRVVKRSLLSGAYSCTEAWEQRLASPVLQKIGAYDLAVRLQEKLDKEGKIAYVDVDILVNKLFELDSQQLDYVQNVLKRFRKTRNSKRITDGTTHAIIRQLIDQKEIDRVMEMLTDKLTYGLFLDNPTANMLLDYLIENKMFSDAARVAYDQMLQEDLHQPLKRHLCWYACHLHWAELHAAQGGEQEEESAEKEEEEPITLRTPFLSTPYYDDHFDLYKDTLKLGKTFVMIAKQQGETDLLCLSYKLIGYGLYEKFSEGLELLKSVTTTDGWKISKVALDDFKQRLDEVETKEPPSEQKPMGDMKMVDVYPFITAEQKAQFQHQLQGLEGELESKIDTESDIGNMLKSQVLSIVEKHQNEDIPELTESFQRWEDERGRLLTEQREAYELQARKEAIARKLQRLQEREEKLRFFEEEDRISLGLSKAPKRKAKKQKDFAEEVFVAPPGERKGN